MKEQENTIILKKNCNFLFFFLLSLLPLISLRGRCTAFVLPSAMINVGTDNVAFQRISNISSQRIRSRYSSPLCNFSSTDFPIGEGTNVILKSRLMSHKGEGNGSENGMKLEEDQDENLDPQIETSLTKVLERARSRKMVLLPYRVQAFFNRPVLTLPNPFLAVFTIGDISFVVVSIWLESYGFALGYSVGRLSIRFMRRSSNMPVMLTELWTVLLAIGFDILWRNSV